MELRHAIPNRYCQNQIRINPCAPDFNFLTGLGFSACPLYCNALSACARAINADSCPADAEFLCASAKRTDTYCSTHSGFADIAVLPAGRHRPRRHQSLQPDGKAVRTSAASLIQLPPLKKASCNGAFLQTNPTIGFKPAVMQGARDAAAPAVPAVPPSPGQEGRLT